jgi:hypothetical protein
MLERLVGAHYVTVPETLNLLQIGEALALSLLERDLLFACLQYLGGRIVSQKAVRKDQGSRRSASAPTSARQASPCVLTVGITHSP